jgi:hypothetical protein
MINPTPLTGPVSVRQQLEKFKAEKLKDCRLKKYIMPVWLPVVLWQFTKVQRVIRKAPSSRSLLITWAKLPVLLTAEKQHPSTSEDGP